MSLITSLQNERVKAAARLRDRRGRDRQGRILIDGARELLRALRAGVRVLDVYWCAELATSVDAAAVLRELRSGRPIAAGPTSADPALADPTLANPTLANPALSFETRLWQVTQPVFEKLAFGERAEGVVGVAEAAPMRLDELQLPPMPLVVVVEGVEKPGNLGAILRTADGAGAAAVIACDGETDWHNPNVIRASLGTVFTQPVCSASTPETLQWLRRQGLRIFAARVEGARMYWDVSWREPAAVVLGAESTGLSEHWQGPDIISIALPMRGVADSLNVSATAAVLCYEAVRQRNG
ncbi:MAG: TrmH family RNA methyltransferase [Planctomycetota bacterium]